MDQLSPWAVDEFLRERFGSGAGNVALLGEGAWSTAYAFRLDGAEMVIRLGEYREDFEKDRVMAAYASPRLPIPAIHEIGEAMGGWFAVSERAYGTYLDDLDEGQMRETLPSLFATIDALHELEPPGQGFGIWGGSGDAHEPSWRSWLLSVTKETARVPDWRASLESVPGAMEAFDAGLAVLRECARDVPDIRCVVHADLLHRNVLVSGKQVSALLDWGSALYGDWLYDYAWLIYCWPWYDPASRIDIRAEIENHLQNTGARAADFEQRLTCCLMHIGLDAQAYNGFRRNRAQLAVNGQRTIEFASRARSAGIVGATDIG